MEFFKKSCRECFEDLEHIADICCCLESGEKNGITALPADRKMKGTAFRRGPCFYLCAYSETAAGEASRKGGGAGNTSISIRHIYFGKRKSCEVVNKGVSEDSSGDKYRRNQNVTELWVFFDKMSEKDK